MLIANPLLALVAEDGNTPIQDAAGREIERYGFVAPKTVKVPFPTSVSSLKIEVEYGVTKDIEVKFTYPALFWTNMPEFVPAPLPSSVPSENPEGTSLREFQETGLAAPFIVLVLSESSEDVVLSNETKVEVSVRTCMIVDISVLKSVSDVDLKLTKVLPLASDVDMKALVKFQVEFTEV